MNRISENSHDRVSINSRSPQERKESLRKVIVQAESLQHGVTEKTIQSLELCMQETDIINSETSIEEKMQNQDEVLMDSELMTISSKVLRGCTRSFTKRMSSYNYVEFVEKIVEHLQQQAEESEEPDWSLLEARITKCFKTTPCYSTLLGTLAPLEKKEVIRRKAIVRDAQAPIKRPENIVTVEKEEEGAEETAQMRDFISRYYKTHRKPLDFFKLVLHPSDFGKTIENILHISFLARDRRIKLMKDSSGLLVIIPCSKDMIAQAAKAGKNVNVQNVIYLTMEQWKTLKDVYRLEEPMVDFSRSARR